MFDRMIQRSIIGALHSSKKPSTTATSSSTSTKSVMIPATVTASTSKPTVVSLPSPPDLKNDQLARLSLYLIQRLWHTIDNKCPERAFSLTKSFERVISKSRVSSQVVYTALIYLHRLFIRSNRQVSRDSELNLFGIAVMLAQKVTCCVSHI